MVHLPDDGELLTRFALAGDEEPFQELLRRHGQMVFQSCWRVLGNSADAEDAAQAVFLTLAQRANDYSLQRSVSLGGWLHTLAWRVAMRLRDAARARHKHEEEARAVNSSVKNINADEDFNWERLCPLLDEALSELPEKYRLPFILCHLEGRSHDEAAALLGMPKRTLGDRLERARELLRKRLAGRGVVCSVAILAVFSAARVGAGELSAAFLASTAKAASCVFAGSLATGGIVSGQTAALLRYASKIVLWGKVKFAAMILILVGLAVTISILPYTVFVAYAMQKVAPLPPVVAPAPVRPTMTPEEIPDEKPTAKADIAITPRTYDARESFNDLREQGIQVFHLGRYVELQIPVALRFVSTPATKLVNAVASAAALKVSWIKEDAVAVLYRGEPDAELAQAEKDLDSADAAVRRDAAWRLGDMQDIRAMPILLKRRRDPDVEVARLAHVGLRRLGWGVSSRAGRIRAYGFREGPGKSGRIVGALDCCRCDAAA
ncbi:MAG: sigE 47 [Gammaproteobacteria bacterium]|nr:sigE 47 [Gammaproteobacteria bacterium]